MNNIKAIGNRSNNISLEGINIKENECIVPENKKQEHLCDSDLLHSKVEKKKRKNQRGSPSVLILSTDCWPEEGEGRKGENENIQAKEINEGKRAHYCTVQYNSVYDG